MVKALILTLLSTSALANCEIRANAAKEAKEAYDNGVDRGVVIIKHQGSSKDNRAIRGMIYSIYEGGGSHLTPNEIYASVKDICEANSKSL